MVMEGWTLADGLRGLAGGLMIGAAASAYLLINGRIMGASGILGGLLDGSGRATASERLALIAGLVGAPALVALAGHAPPTHLTGALAIVIVAGLLVGLGTRLANGCTSGHGVCGISRLSIRGIVATLLYLLSGAVTMALARHVWGII